MSEKTKLLIIEDETTILELLKAGLKYEGYQVLTAETGREGLSLLEKEDVDLLILDIMLPDIDGFELCRKIRAKGFDLPILMLTAKKEVQDRVTGLDAGADDYLTKPFNFEELLARVRALLRRYGRKQETTILVRGDLSLNLETREVTLSGRPLKLTPIEFKLLELFMKHPKRVFTRQTLLHRVWGYDYVGNTNIVDVHINHLRNKIGDQERKLIRTHYGVGYSFHPED